MSLIEELGRDYFNEMCINALLLHNDTVYKIVNSTSSSVILENMEDRNVEERLSLPHDFFTGWKVFAYPVLGYRRLGEHVVGYANRRQSTRRGLRADSLNFNLCPSSNFLVQNGLARTPNATERSVAAMKPKFDRYEEALPELLAGERCSIVLSDNLLIDTDCEGNNPLGFNVYMRTRVIGRMDRRGRIRWTDPALSDVLAPFRNNNNG